MEKEPKNQPEYELEATIDRYVEQELSTTWYKTIPEILPGYLPDLPTSDLAQEQQELYRAVYKKLCAMVKQDIVEMRFRELENEEFADGSTRQKNRPEFKRKTHGGTRDRVLSTTSTTTEVPQGSGA